MFALVDCNNFYASCERVFKPALEKKPVVILSNNDGCVIARSNEAKKLSIPMGAPFFAWRHFFNQHQVHVFSSNYALYGDMSNRVMTSLNMLCPSVEIYSIDEAFLSFENLLPDALLLNALSICRKIKQWTGIPVSVGLAPTKTLAKIANHIAKKKTLHGIFNLTDLAVREKILSEFPVADIWGVGRRTAIKLKEMDINTAKELQMSDLKIMRRKFSVVMEKLISELRGISCLPLEDIHSKKQIMSSRSFGRPTTKLAELEEAISSYTAVACIKLRNQKSVAKGIYIYICTNLHSQNSSQYSNSTSAQFLESTDDTRIIIKTALNCLRQIYKSGYQYKKAGIVLFDLSKNVLQQLDLFSENKSPQSVLMKTFDNINNKLGKNTIFLGAEGIERSWQSISNRRSPRYTTQWNELVKVICK